MNLTPHEIALGEVLMPPLLVAGALGVLVSMLTANLFNRFRLSRYLANPPLVLIALTAIYTVIIGTYVIRI